MSDFASEITQKKSSCGYQNSKRKEKLKQKYYQVSYRAPRYLHFFSLQNEFQYSNHNYYYYLWNTAEMTIFDENKLYVLKLCDSKNFYSSLLHKMFLRYDFAIIDFF